MTRTLSFTCDTCKERFEFRPNDIPEYCPECDAEDDFYITPGTYDRMKKWNKEWTE